MTDDPMDALERSLATVFRVMTDRVMLNDLAQRCGYDLPAASWALLEHLDTHGALRVSDIAMCHGVDVSSITPRLKRLENDGLLRRDREPGDARAFLITITSEGIAALNGLHAARRGILQGALTGAESHGVECAAEVLTRIARTLSPTPPISGRR